MARLPPLTELRAFEAAARHLSFKAAATELGEQLLEIGQGNALPLGDVGEGHRPALRVQRKIEHGSHGVTAFGGQSHGLVPRWFGKCVEYAVFRVKQSTKRPSVSLG